MEKNKEAHQAVNVDISAIDNLKCSNEECKSELFILNYFIKKISALQAPSGQETMVPLQVFACALCGTVHEDFLPEN